MEFERDENKNQYNIDKHDIDFNQAKAVFNDEKRIESVDNRKNYGETRIKTIGKALDLILSVVYTMRATVTRIISARPAGKKERDVYLNQV
jgi:uncharacterized protein